jgi:hypothetical protein
MTIYLPYYKDHTPVVIDRHLKLSDFIALEELNIHIQQRGVRERPTHSSCDDGIVELCVLLCDPSSRCPLHTVHISIQMADLFPKRDFFDPDLTSDWILLDEALCNTGFVSLRKVSLCFNFLMLCQSGFPFERSVFTENAKASLKRVFPIISASTSVEFLVDIQVHYATP